MEEALDTFPRWLLHNAAVRPRHPATREKDLGIWQTWTWGEVADEVRAIACGLASIGFKRGDHLAVIGDNRPRLYWAMVAAQCVGGVPVPMYLAGAEVSHFYPFGPTAGSAVNVTLMSYRDTCCIGVNTDAAAIPDPDEFRACLLEGFAEVLALAGR